MEPIKHPIWGGGRAWNNKNAFVTAQMKRSEHPALTERSGVIADASAAKLQGYKHRFPAQKRQDKTENRFARSG